MSLPTGFVRCHGCDFEGVMQRRPVTLMYSLPTGDTVKGYRQFAWCTSCEDVTEAEEGFDVGSIQSEIASLDTNRPALFVRLVDRALGGAKHVDSEREMLQRKLTLAKLRTSPPRCLRCGEATVTSLKFDSNGTSNVVHSCGRRLFAVPDDPDAPRFFYKEEVIELDLEGKKTYAG